MVRTNADDDARLLAHITQLDNMPLTLQPLTALMLLGTIQLALRHPENKGPSSETMRALCEMLISFLADENPHIETLLRRGFDPDYDC